MQERQILNRLNEYALHFQNRQQNLVHKPFHTSCIKTKKSIRNNLYAL